MISAVSTRHAEAGYDVDETLRRRSGRPPIGSAAASVEPVRLDPELRQALTQRAERDHLVGDPQGVAQVPPGRLTVPDAAAPAASDVPHGAPAPMGRGTLKGRARLSRMDRVKLVGRDAQLLERILPVDVPPVVRDQTVTEAHHGGYR